MSNKQSRVVAQQTFRQFAWLLAGTLATGKPAAKPKPAGKP